MKKIFLLLMLLIVCILGYAQSAELTSTNQIGDAVANAGLTKKRLFTFQLKMTGGGGTLTDVTFSTSGNYTANELNKLELYYNTANTFTSATSIKSLTSNLETGSHIFSGLNKALGNGNHYFWITADIAQSIIPNHTISVPAISTNDITFSGSVYKSGSTSAGGTQYLEYVVVTENFDGTWPPSGWTFYGANRSSPAYSGAYSLELQPAGDYAYTRKVNTPGLITFFAMVNTGSQYSFEIQCSTDTTNWTNITTYSNTANSLTRSFKFYSIDVHAATYTNVYFRFYLASGNGDIHIDDVNITLRSPNTQASNVTFSDIGPSRFTVSCTAGSAAQRIMFMKEGNVSPVDADNGVFYTASTNWNDKGSQIGSSGFYCIYRGTGTSVSVTGLTKNTTYTVEVMEYNYSDVANTYIYMPSPAYNHTTTASTDPPSAIIFDSVTSSSFNLSWSTTTGLSYVLFLKEDTSVYPPTPSGTYTASSDWSNKGSQLETSGFYCVYNDTGNNVTVTNLQSSTRYYAVIFTLHDGTYSSGCACGGEVPTATKAADYFASIASGNWAQVHTWDSTNHSWAGNTTWKSSRDGTHWNDATAKPTSSAAKVYIESGHIVTLTANESCNNLHFDGGWIQLGNFNLTINSYDSASGNPQFIYNGTGAPQMTTQGTNYIVSVTSQSITSLPSEVYTLRINLTGSDTLSVPLPNDVTVTNLAFDNGGLRMNSHTIKY